MASDCLSLVYYYLRKIRTYQAYAHYDSTTATHSGQVGALEALGMGALSSLVQKPEENIEVLPYFPHAMVPTTGGSRVVGTF